MHLATIARVLGDFIDENPIEINENPLKSIENPPKSPSERQTAKLWISGKI